MQDLPANRRQNIPAAGACWVEHGFQPEMMTSLCFSFVIENASRSCVEGGYLGVSGLFSSPFNSWPVLFMPFLMPCAVFLTACPVALDVFSAVFSVPCSVICATFAVAWPVSFAALL